MSKQHLLNWRTARQVRTTLGHQEGLYKSSAAPMTSPCNRTFKSSSRHIKTTSSPINKWICIRVHSNWICLRWVRITISTKIMQTRPSLALTQLSICKPINSFINLKTHKCSSSLQTCHKIMSFLKKNLDRVRFLKPFSQIHTLIKIKWCISNINRFKTLIVNNNSNSFKKNKI